MKAAQVDIQLIARLTSQPPDSVAQSELFGLCYESLINWLKKQFPKVDVDDVCEIAFQTLNQFVKSPKKFDPEKKTLMGYLQMDAAGDLLNRLKKISKEKKRRVFVEDWEDHRNTVLEKESNQEFENQALALFEAKLHDLLPDKTDFSIARMMELGIRETEEYVKALKVEHLSLEEQRKVVKRHKDRIKKQLERSDWEVYKKQIRENYL